MLSVTDFNSLCQSLVQQLPGLRDYVLVAEDNHAISKLKSRQGIQLVAVIPSAALSGAPGRPVDNQTTFLFIVEKLSPSTSDRKELELFQRTQDITLAIRQYLLDQQANGCSIFFRLHLPTIQIDPEFNIFGGFSGWSMTFIW